MPSDQMSVRASTCSARACSGDIYATVPITMPAEVREAKTRAFGDAGIIRSFSLLFAISFSLLREQFREAEVQDLHEAVTTQHDVFRLDVTMNYARLMRCLKR